MAAKEQIKSQEKIIQNLHLLAKLSRNSFNIFLEESSDDILVCKICYKIETHIHHCFFFDFRNENLFFDVLSSRKAI